MCLNAYSLRYKHIQIGVQFCLKLIYQHLYLSKYERNEIIVKPSGVLDLENVRQSHFFKFLLCGLYKLIPVPIHFNLQLLDVFIVMF